MVVALSSKLVFAVSTCLHRASCCLVRYGVAQVDAFREFRCTLMKTAKITQSNGFGRVQATVGVTGIRPAKVGALEKYCIVTVEACDGKRKYGWTGGWIGNSSF